MVENQPTLPEVLHEFDTWLRDRDIINSRYRFQHSFESLIRFMFVTCGDWDLQLQLPAEAKHKNFEVPEYLIFGNSGCIDSFSYFSEWINVKKSFCSHRGYFAPGMKHLLKELQLSHSVSDINFIARIQFQIL